jgi:hypothetical protein
MGRDINNKIRRSQNMCRPSPFTLLNGARYIFKQKALVAKVLKATIQHAWKAKVLLVFRVFQSQFRKP